MGKHSYVFIEHVTPESNYLEYIDLYSFSGKSWQTTIEASSESQGIAFSKDERQIILVCTDYVYTLDATNGKIINKKAAEWCQSR